MSTGWVILDHLLKYLALLWSVRLNSTIHKAASLMVSCCSMILPGTIPETPISHEWNQELEWLLRVIPAGRIPG